MVQLDYEQARNRMVEQQIIARGVKDPLVIKAMRKVPRHLFVDEGLRTRSYDDYPLPISHGQTISQPYIVALMTEALNLKGGEKVLEIGTGSGYQSAILAEIVDTVYSVERIPGLAKKSREILDSLGYYNVIIKVGDGTYGWKDKAPFDGIIVTASAPSIPDPLLEQLKDGGRLIIPVGDFFSQDLILVRREGNRFIKSSYGGVRFVKLIGAFGWKEE
jgi:protein-L-isoaspartate(D-aspartate) O-methyltransferase